MSCDLRYLPVGQPTGRPAFPSFVARSRATLDSVLNHANQWAGMWEAARQAILRGETAGPIYETARWSGAQSGTAATSIAF